MIVADRDFVVTLGICFLVAVLIAWLITAWVYAPAKRTRERNKP